jgi:hypothetical protein
MTGDRMAHPLLISLANIRADVRMKSSNHAYHLLALLPIPKFIEKNKKIRSVLEHRLIHQCFDIVLEPLKQAAMHGTRLPDPHGGERFGYTTLASCTVDTPEAAMLAGVCGKTSPVTMASFKEFGDPFQHVPRTAAITLSQLHSITSKVDPSDVRTYVSEANKFRLSGVDKPFWRDWAHADPYRFLTPEPLHHYAKQFFDHTFKWCRALGAEEIDFRFSVLQPHVGFRHFKDGVSALKQVTGRDQRNLMRYIVPIIAQAAPSAFVTAIRAQVDFWYLTQAPIQTDVSCEHALSALAEFHAHKQAILDQRVRVGKAKKPIDNWQIPKLELSQSVVPNIKESGAIFQWTADVTEHLHIEVAKDPGRSGNGQEYEGQICRYLDRRDKVRLFDLATSMKQVLGHQFNPEDLEADASNEQDEDLEPENARLQWIDRHSQLQEKTRAISSPRCQPSNYFHTAIEDRVKHPDNRRVFVLGPYTAIRLNRDPRWTRLSISDVSAKYNLPDFRLALLEYFQRRNENMAQSNFLRGRRSARLHDTTLPFTHIDVWTEVRLQTKDYLVPSTTLPPSTLCAFPPSEEWPLGRYDAVLINVDANQHWPMSGLSGMLPVYSNLKML